MTQPAGTTKWVYPFDEGGSQMRDLLGGKGAGLAEMTRLGTALGARPETFSGLAGVGDLVTTCMSRHSRNRFVGEEIAKGRTLDEIVSGMVMVAEGVPTAKAAVELAEKHNVVMPIDKEVYNVLFEGKDPREAIKGLMTRDPRPEIW